MHVLTPAVKETNWVQEQRIVEVIKKDLPRKWRFGLFVKEPRGPGWPSGKSEGGGHGPNS